MLGNKAAASGRSGAGIGQLRLRSAAASGRSGGGILRLRLRPAIPIIPGCRGKRQRRAAAVPLLPDDALVEIFSRVPAKSLCRFKCVSRAWRDLLADRLRCKKLPHSLEGFFVNDDEMYGGDRDDYGSDRVVGRFINTLGRFVPLASFTFLGNQPGIEEPAGHAESFLQRAPPLRAQKGWRHLRFTGLYRLQPRHRAMSGRPQLRLQTCFPIGCGRGPWLRLGH